MIRIAVVLAVVAGLFSVAIPASGAAPDGGASISSHSCNLKGKWYDFPPASYVTKVAVSGTSCGTGFKVIRGFHKCRKANGGAAGHCGSKIKKFRCKEGKRSSVPGVQYSSSVTCRKGGAKIHSSYTQNL